MSLAVVRTADRGMASEFCSGRCDLNRWDGSRAPVLVVVKIGPTIHHLCAECAVGLVDLMSFQISDLAKSIRSNRSRRGG